MREASEDLERRTVRGAFLAADMCLTGTEDLERRPVRRAGFRAAVAVAFAGRSEPVWRSMPMRKAVRSEQGEPDVLHFVGPDQGSWREGRRLVGDLRGIGRSRLSSSCGSCLRRSLRTVLAEQGGDESVLFGALLYQTTDHGGKFGDLCSRPGGKRAVGENPCCYHV